MPAEGQKQTDETKKKISEALKKPGSGDQPTGTPMMPKSEAARALFVDYQKNKSETEKLRAERDALMAAKKGSKRGTSKGATKKIKEIQKKLNALQKERKTIRQEAMRQKRLAKAKQQIDKSNARLNKLGDLEKTVQDMMAKSKKPDVAARQRERLDRIARARDQQGELIAKSSEIISNKGEVPGGSDWGTFNFSERTGKPFWRALTEYEGKVNFVFLNDQFNNIEDVLERELEEEAAAMTQDYTDRTKRKLDAGDIAGIGAMSLPLFFVGNIRRKIRDAMSAAFDIGKKSASKELKVGVPATSKISTQIQGIDAGDAAETFTAEMDKTAKSIITNGLAAGAAVPAIVARVREDMAGKAASLIPAVSGRVVGQYANRGRREVFTENIVKVTRFQRSEVLDGRTCNVCLSLDKRVIPASSPMLAMDLVHTHCRGLWVPIFSYETQPEIRPIPKAITDAFVMIDGKPTINGFKQIKNAVGVSEAAQKEIEKRINDKLK